MYLRFAEFVEELEKERQQRMKEKRRVTAKIFLRVPLVTAIIAGLGFAIVEHKKSIRDETTSQSIDDTLRRMEAILKDMETHQKSAIEQEYLKGHTIYQPLA